MPQVLLRCIDDSNRPSDIPKDKWIKQGEVYTAINAGKGANCYYFVLKEIDLTSYFPYKGFATSRFTEI